VRDPVSLIIGVVVIIVLVIILMRLL